MPKQVLVEMSPSESNRVRRVVERLQKAQQLEKFISDNVWTLQVQLEQLADQEVEEARRHWRELLLKYKIDPLDQDVQLDWGTGQIWREVEESSGTDSQSDKSNDTDSAVQGVERDGGTA